MNANRRRITLICLAFVVLGCSEEQDQPGGVTAPSKVIDFNLRPQEHAGPWIGEITVANAQSEPLQIDFTVRIRGADGDYPAFPEHASLWLCVGVPTVEKSYREALSVVLKRAVVQWRDGVEVVRGKVLANSVDYVSGNAAFNVPRKETNDEVTRGLVGRGYTAFVCHSIKRNEDGSFSASMRASGRNYPGDHVTLSAPNGNVLFNENYPAVALPVSWMIWNEQTDQLSNERRGIVNLKLHQLVRLLPD